MSKIGIITLNGYFNYGNRLQNLALQNYLEEQGHEVTTVRLDRANNSSKLNIFKYRLKIVLQRIMKNKQYNSHKIREEKFKDFSNKYIKETKLEYSIYGNLSHLNDKFDYFIIGSDQVWNPNMSKGSLAYFANFADTDKRISYSASFGVSNIPSEYTSTYIEGLQGLNYISVREQVGANIVKELTGREAPVLVDPTLLLNKEEWIKVSSAAPQTHNSYLLTYFLGGIPKEHREKIEQIAALNNLEIISLGDINDKVTYETGPAEFLNYIQGAQLFCTDSFHGCVFSIIFETPFVVYERQGKTSMFSRIETLLSTFDLEDRINGNINYENLFEINFQHSKDVQNKEINKSFTYLTEALKQH